MTVQMTRGNPAIEAFDTTYQHARRARIEDQAELERQATDRAIRTELARFYANTPQGAGPAVLPIAPPPPQPAAIAQPAEAGATAPTGSMPPAVPAPSGPSDAAEGGGTAATAAANQAVAAAAPLAQPAPQVAPSGGTPRVLPAAVSQATDSMQRGGGVLARAGQDPRLQAVMQGLSKAPGAGRTMLSMFNTDLVSQRSAAAEQMKVHQEGLKMFLEAARSHDVPTMRVIANKYGLGIPPETFNNREVLAGLQIAPSIAKQLGITDDDKALAFTKGFMEAGGHRPNATPEQLQNAVARGRDEAARASGFQVSGHFVGDNRNVMFYDKKGNVQDSGQKARPQKFELYGPGGAAGGGETATIRNRRDLADWIKKASPGIDDQTVAKFVVNPRAQITPQDVMRVRAQLQRLKTRTGRPVYSEADLDAATRKTIRDAQEAAGVGHSYMQDSPNPSPTPGPAAPAAAAPSAGGGREYNFDPATNSFR